MWVKLFALMSPSPVTGSDIEEINVNDNTVLNKASLKGMAGCNCWAHKHGRSLVYGGLIQGVLYQKKKF